MSVITNACFCISPQKSEKIGARKKKMIVLLFPSKPCFVFCLFLFVFFKRKWDEKLKTSKHAVCLCCQMEEIEISPRLWESGITLSAEDCGATDHCTSSSCEICFLIASCFCWFLFFFCLFFLNLGLSRPPPYFILFFLVHSSFLSLSSPRNIFQLLMNHIGSNTDTWNISVAVSYLIQSRCL